MDFMRGHFAKKGKKPQAAADAHKYNPVDRQLSTEENHLTDLVLGRFDENAVGASPAAYLASSSELF